VASHQRQDRLLRHWPGPAELGVDPPMPIPALGADEDRADRVRGVSVPVRFTRAGLLVEERGAGKTGDLQQRLE
jgi:hypothetical protein